ncbi:MAG: hypothetical protein M1816_004793 [Peltula sp. TS41687]|nr:MAG: hypothetical protein M1816_004793 [Peltula sp. TS41687]
MTRPQIIRADTIDLQDPRAPSAQDHTRHPSRLHPLGPSSHQADALRHAEQDAADEQQRSPRVSWGDGDLLLESRPAEKTVSGQESHDGRRALDDQTARPDEHRRDSPAEDADLADGEEDDGLDDDMMDKISSSPSIDDGGYHRSQDLPVKAISPLPTLATSNPFLLHHPTGSCSTLSFVSTSSYISPFSQRQEGEYHHHHHHRHLQGEDLGDKPFDSNHSSLDSRSESQQGYQTESSDADDEGFFDAFEDLEDSYGEPGEGIEPENQTLFLTSREDHYSKGTMDGNNSLSPRVSGLQHIPRFTATHETRREDDDDDDFEDDDDTDVSFSNDTRFIDSGWGGECLRDETEDINFQFVYALHGFPATVDGQANASKGDTMILLDDRNSYWWLVRIVKDDSIGYLPAEYIETPTERLARLNKHRNIDLSAPMLGDNPERSKNSLKNVMKRRNAKTVQFSAPTYHEASEVDYSTEEEELDQDGDQADDNVEAESGELDHDNEENQDEITTAEPVQPSGQDVTNNAGVDKVERGKSPLEGEKDIGDHPGGEPSMSKDSPAERQVDMINKSRKGVVRNTDSFFKDDNGETRKITLTPNLLRDDSSRNLDFRDLKTKGSLELLEKTHTGSEKVKEDSKKKKEKKPGMLSGLFRRKDKKKGIVDEDTDDVSPSDKRSGETLRESPIPKGSEESSRSDGHNTQGMLQQMQQGSLPIKDQPNKLQKKSRIDNPSVKEQSLTPSHITRGEKPPSSLVSQSRPSDKLAPSVMSATAPGIRLVGQDDETERRGRSLESTRMKSPEGVRKEEVGKVESTALRRDEIESTKISTEGIRQVNSSAIPSFSNMGGLMVNQSKKEDDTIHKNDKARQGDATNENEVTRLSESPVQISLPEEGEQPSITTATTRLRSPGLVDDMSRPEAETEVQEPESSARTSTSSASSPEMVDAPEIHVNNNLPRDHQNKEPIQTQATTSDSSPATISSSSASSSSASPMPTQTSLPKWNPQHLLDNYEALSSDIRDLLRIVYDTTGVEPAGPDHPLMANLFKEERRRLAEMNTQ